MFKDDFKKQFDDISLDADAKERIKATLESVEPKTTKQKNPAIPWRIGFAVAAAIAIVMSVAFGHFNRLPSIAPEISDTETVLIRSQSYNEIYKALEEIRKAQMRDEEEITYEYIEDFAWESDGDFSATAGTGGAGTTGSVSNNTSDDGFKTYSAQTGALQPRNKGEEEYSKTNIQVEGVDESDIVKTDGRYIYSLKDDTVRIAEANSGSPHLISTLALPDDGERYYFDMYLSDNTLIVIGSVYTKFGSSIVTDKIATMDMVVLGGDTEFIAYDMTDPASPRLIGSYSQSGEYNSSRMIDGKLYILSNHLVSLQSMKKDDPKTYIPTLTNGDKTVAMAPECVMSPSCGVENASYLVVCSYEAKNARLISSVSLLGSSDTVYSSTQNIITASSKYDGEKDHKQYTEVSRFSITDGAIDYKGTGMVPGYLLDQFSIDEHNGFFRFVTTEDVYKQTEGTTAKESGETASHSTQKVTDGESTASYSAGGDDVVTNNESQTVSKYIKYTVTTQNGLYVLDGELKPVGNVSGLAEDERVYSVRFMGDTAYFVTFRQVDPLFSVDLSDPKNPKVIGELKIPGFSEFLYPYGEGQLLGIGQETDENGRLIKGIKLSMFDISDPANVTEKDKYVLDYAIYSEALYSHKACIVHEGKNLIGFSVHGKSATTKGNSYVLYTFNGGFNELMRVACDDYGPVRGLFIGDVFYIVGNRSIRAFSLETYEEIGVLTFS